MTWSQLDPMCVRGPMSCCTMSRAVLQNTALVTLHLLQFLPPMTLHEPRIPRDLCELGSIMQACYSECGIYEPAAGSRIRWLVALDGLHGLPPPVLVTAGASAAGSVLRLACCSDSRHRGQCSHHLELFGSSTARLCAVPGAQAVHFCCVHCMHHMRCMQCSVCNSFTCESQASLAASTDFA
jgi:hypothetical protein